MDLNKVDIWEFESGVAYMDSDPVKAREIFSKYIEDHPQDYVAYCYYASIHVILGEFDRAEEILDHVEELVQEDETFREFKSRSEYFDKMITFTRIKVLAYKEEYEFLDKNYNLYLKKLKTLPVNEVEYLIRLKSGRLNNEKREDMGGYVFKQMFEYREEDFREHIKPHLYEYSGGGFYESDEKSIFGPDFPLDIVLEEVKKYIPSDRALYFGFTNNTYIFKYDFCGKTGRKNTDYFKVITLHGTSNIISMYPTSGDMKLPYVNLNYIQENTPKKQKMSQIERFNKRYRR